MNAGKIHVVFMTVLLLFGSSLVSVELKAEKQSLQFKKDLMIGKNSGDDNYIFSTVSDVDLDKEGNIYILDAMDNRIQKFDEQGTFLNSIKFKRGQGPEEISFSPIMAVTPEGEIAILDLMGRKILIYGIEGVFKSFFKLDFQPLDLEFYIDNNLAILGLFENKIIHIYDLGGRHQQSFGEPFSIPKKHAQYKDMPTLKLPRRLDSSQDGTLYLLNPHEYEILVYTEGVLKKKIPGKNKLYRPLSIAQSNIGGAGIISPVMFAFGWKNYLFVTIQGPGMDPVNEIEFFIDDKSLISQVLDGFPYTIDPQGRLYIIEAEEYPVMTRYSILE